LHRTLLSLSVALGAVLLAALPLRGDDGATDDVRAQLEAELEALLTEIERPASLDPFEAGRSPDLIVVSTQSVLGEVAPCG
jgi:hypothetical protein